MQYCPSQHFNDIQTNTYVYSVTPVTAQDYSAVYTRVFIHTLFSCQVCFKENRRLAFYRDDGSAWSLMVHQLSWAKVATSTTSFELPSESTCGQTRSTYQVCDKWPTCQAADQSTTQTLNCGNTSRSSKNSNVSSWTHPPVTNRMDVTHLPFRQDYDGDSLRPRTDLSPLRGARKE